jgi:RNA polymerase sigma-70 factor (ECF subfamily)
MPQGKVMITNQATVTDKPRRSPNLRRGLCDRSAEQALVAAAQEGITEAMNELLVRHKRALYRAARRFTSSHEDAEDLVQDALLKAFVNVRKFRNECHFATWLIAIVNNTALSMKRKRKNTYFVSLDSSREETSGTGRWDIPDVRSDPEEETMRQELLAFLQAIVLRQSPKHQVILERCVFDESRIGDAASSLGLTMGSAKSSLYRARRRVSESFKRRGLLTRRKLPNHQGAVTERSKNAENL